LSDASNVIALTQQLVRINTVNPPGNEGTAAHVAGGLLEKAGFSVAYHELSPGRLNVIAGLKGPSNEKPLCFTGHLDTVPLGAADWSADPFGGDLASGKLFGRGTTDMKAGLAAMLVAAIETARRPIRRGLKLVLTAGEETGCEGAMALARSGALGEAGAVIVGEPSSNRPFVGHRGALWLKLVHTGRTAHGSMPELGDNAVIKAAHTIAALDDFGFNAVPHPVLGKPSINIGYIHGGANVNSVPDRAEIGLDIRTVPGQDHGEICERIAAHSHENCIVESTLDLQSVYSDRSNEWLIRTLRLIERVTGMAETGESGAPYFTDAAVLNPAFGHPPFIILGPGEAVMAHQTDEYCVVERIEEAADIYRLIAADWCESALV
jgi:succinyl-diaminopimelate desuccinylase